MLISMLSIGAYTVIDTSKTVEANEGSIYDIQEYISEQRMANKLMQEIQQQYQYQNQRQQSQTIYNPPPYEPPPRRCWDYADDGYEYEYDCYTGNWL